jgi:hypothetical protein
MGWIFSPSDSKVYAEALPTKFLCNLIFAQQNHRTYAQDVHE